MLGLVLFHGVFWSGLLSASSAYMTDVIPEARRAEGIGYWGLSTIVAVAVAPAIGFAVYRHGWIWLCAVTAALNLADGRHRLQPRGAAATPPPRTSAPFFTRGLLEWRVLLVSFTLFLYSFGYGGITSFVALYADANHIAPKGIFFTVMSVVILLTRPLSGRAADRLGYKKILFPSLTLIALGLALLAASATRAGLVAAAIVFGGGFGSAYPAFAAHVDDPRGRRAAGGGLRRDPGRLRHRDRHRVHRHRLDHPPLRLFARVRGRRPCWRPWPCRSSCWRRSACSRPRSPPSCYSEPPASGTRLTTT